MTNKIKTILDKALIPMLLFILLLQIIFYVLKLDYFYSWMLIFYGIVSILLIIYLCTSNIHLFSPFFVIVLYSIISHFGMCIIAIFQKENVYNYMYTNRHVYVNYLSRALQISTIGIITLIIGYRSKKVKITSKLQNNIKHRTSIEIHNSNKKKYLMISYIAIYFYAILLIYLALHYNLFNTSYIEVKELLISNAAFVYFRTIFWVAIVPIAIFFDRKVFKIILIPIFAITFILLFSGNRNDVLYPLAIGYSLYCYNNKKTSKLVNTLSIIILFVLSPAIADNRSSGDIFAASYSLNIIDAIMEMGAQIRPLTVTISLIERGVISHLKGMSLIDPMLALLNLGIFYSGNSYRQSINYVPNILAIDNHYGQGYSMISELWLNFGIIGLIIICFFIGYRCASVEKNDLHNTHLIKYGGWVMLLFYWVRNSLQMNFIIVILTYIMVFICEKVVVGRRF